MVNTSLIRERMEVYSSDGERVGHVSSLGATGFGISAAGGTGSSAHQIPADWVTRVDEHVHLRHTAAVIRGRLQGIPEPAPHPTEGRARVPWLIGIVFLVILLFLLVWGCVYNADGSTDTTQPLPSTGQSGGEGS